MLRILNQDILFIIMTFLPIIMIFFIRHFFDVIFLIMIIFVMIEVFHWIVDLFTVVTITIVFKPYPVIPFVVVPMLCFAPVVIYFLNPNWIVFFVVIIILLI